MDAPQFVERLRRELQTPPGETGQLEAMPLNRPLTSEILRSAHSFRRSAVGIILYPNSGSIYSVLIRRPEYDGAHSSQIAFPGGKMDEDDRDLEATARRECFEEIRFPADKGELLGELTQVYIPVSSFLVHPFVFYTPEMPELLPDPREVDGIIHFDIFQLRDESILQQTDMRFKDGLVRRHIPYYAINGHTVWGATAMMLSEFKTILKRF